MPSKKPLTVFIVFLIICIIVVDASISVAVSAYSVENATDAIPVEHTVVPMPAVSAHSAVLIEAESGTVLFEKNASERLPMASTTKIMTALVAISESDPDDNVCVSSDAAGTEGSSIYLSPGEVLSVGELIYALLLESANDAAAALAIGISGSTEAFSELMNDYATRLGLTETHFTNPHGLNDEEHYTTAFELALLAAHALTVPEFASVVSTYRRIIGENGSSRLLINHNRLLITYDGCIGVKTGYTSRSGRCLVSAAERNGVRLIAVTLNAPDDWDDHRLMLDYGFSRCRRVLLAEAGNFNRTVPTVSSPTPYTVCANTESASVTLTDISGEPRCITELPMFLFAPVSRGDPVGRVVWYDGERELASIGLVAMTDAPAEIYRDSLWRRITDFLKNLFHF